MLQDDYRRFDRPSIKICARSYGVSFGESKINPGAMLQ